MFGLKNLGFHNSIFRLASTFSILWFVPSGSLLVGAGQIKATGVALEALLVVVVVVVQGTFCRIESRTLGRGQPEWYVNYCVTKAEYYGA